MPAPVRQKPRESSIKKHAPLVTGVLAVPLVIGGYFGVSQMKVQKYDSGEPQPEVLVESDRNNDATTTTQVLEENPLVEELQKRTDNPFFADGIPTYLPIPESLRAIYMTQCVSGTPSFRADLVKLAEETEINAIMIDVKDFSGGLGYVPIHPDLQPFESDRCGAYDLKEFLAELKEKGIFTIARVTVFQDPLYTVANPDVAVRKASNPDALWSDHKGLHFIDVSAKKYWDYIITLSREVHAMGFEEINYDYIRFPSDGPMNDIYFPHSKDMSKPEAVERFWKFLHDTIKDPSLYPEGVQPPIISGDLFGMTATNIDDLSIGQQLERAMPHFDYIAPMVYPSHYPKGWNGFANPNNNVYDVVHISMDSAGDRAEATQTPVETLDGEPIYETREVVVTPATASSSAVIKTEEVFTGMYTKNPYPRTMMRTWIQDFDYGGNYDIAEVKAQIQATYDAGLTSWMIWSPSNRYTRGALEDA